MSCSFYVPLKGSGEIVELMGNDGNSEHILKPRTSYSYIPFSFELQVLMSSCVSVTQ